jgi:GH18 family chitinase
LFKLRIVSWKQSVRSSAVLAAGLVATALLAPTMSSGQSPVPEERSAAAADRADWRFHEPAPKLVGYLPDYDGSYGDFAKSLDFRKMTHLYLAFGLPPFCNGTCTKESDMTFSLQQTDADIHTIVKTAHEAGTKVILSIGGGGGDQQILQFYDAGLSKQLVKSLDKYVHEHDLDGVDLDIEDPDHMGQPYLEFTKTLIETFHPQGKIVTAAVAEYLQDSMPDAALHLFDFVNVMNYSNYSDAEQAMTYYGETKKVPKEKITLGVPFFAQSGDGNIEETFSTVLAAYPNAFNTDMESGGDLDGGVTLYYVGGATMARETELGKKYGGIMIWELSQDGAPPNSLYSVIAGLFPRKQWW